MQVAMMGLVPRQWKSFAELPSGKGKARHGVQAAVLSARDMPVPCETDYRV